MTRVRPIPLSTDTTNDWQLMDDDERVNVLIQVRGPVTDDVAGQIDALVHRTLHDLLKRLAGRLL